MAHIIAAKVGGHMLEKAFSSSRERRNNNYHPRFSRRTKFIGGTAIVAFAGGVIGGFPKMLENIDPITTETTVDGGSQELIEFDVDSELKCWTSARIQVANASAKSETFAEALGVKSSTGYTEVKAQFQVEETVCKDESPIHVVRQPGERRYTMSLNDSDALYTKIDLVPGTFFPSTDQKGTDAVGGLFIKATESAPYLGETQYSDALSLTEDMQNNKLATLALFAGMMNAKENCEDMTKQLAGPSVELGLKNMYLPGMNIVLKELGEKEIGPEDIDVLVEGQPISKLKILGETTTIDKDYAKAMEIQDAEGDITINQGNKADCKSSAEVQEMLDEAERRNKAEGRI